MLWPDSEAGACKYPNSTKVEGIHYNQYLLLVIKVPISATEVLVKKNIVLVECAEYNQNDSEDC